MVAVLPDQIDNQQQQNPDSDLKMGYGDIMTWFPRREDYEDAPVAVMPDETIEEKIDRKVVALSLSGRL